MASSSASKKRKREDFANNDKGSFQLSNQNASQLGPVLVSFPALEPSKSTSFQCYRYKKRKADATPEEDGAVEFAKQDTLVAGEAESVEFFSSDESGKAGVGCRYYVAIHNNRTQTTTFRPAPLHILTQKVKAFKGLEPAAVTAKERTEARNALGESFGTKKSKAAIKTAERNKVDVSAMEGVIQHLVDRIDIGTASLPTKDELKANADSSRLIPPFNASAHDPSEVYHLHDIVPDAEWRAVSTSALTSAKSDKDRIALLPYKRSTWINQHLTLIFKSANPSKHDLKLIIYIATMFAFRQCTFKLGDKSKLGERLSGVPSIILDGLLSRFTETPRESTQAQTTTETQTNLLTHMFALCLRLDNYATDTIVLGSDLSMAIPKINQLFKSLGCQIGKLTDRDLKRLGLPDSASETKRAILKVPLEFPKVKFNKKR